MDRTWTRLGRLVVDGARAVAARHRSGGRRTSSQRRTGGGSPERARSGGSGGYPGDFTGTARIEYAPSADDRADPGEVVWGWVPYEEDHSQGKDRPALVVGRDGRWVLALMLTSRDHDADARPSGGGSGRGDWLDVGTGAWDTRGRPSEVRLDRVLRLDPDGIRREGARLERAVFDQVAAVLRGRYGWS